MANNYLQFAFSIKVPESQRAWFQEIAGLMEDLTGEELDEEDPQHAKLLDAFPHWNDYQTAGFDIYYGEGRANLVAEENGDTESVISLLARLMERSYNDQQQKFDFLPPDKVEMRQVAFTYACTCSSLRDNEFSGGAIHVFMNGSKAESQYIDAYEWMQGVTEEYTEKNARSRR